MDIYDFLLHFLYAFTTIFIIVNPVEASLVFVALTYNLNSPDRRHIYRRTTSVAFFVAFFFALAGDMILHIFGITVDSLRVAGGILLFLVAIDMLQGVSQQSKITEAELIDANHREDISVFPLAIPLLTGPGAITTVVVLMGATATLVEKGLVLLAIVLTFLSTFYILKFSEHIDQALGITGIMVLTRTMGLILGAVAVDFVAKGAWNLYRSMAGA
jgi:multiple antibiotic resistance protein